MTSFDEKHRAWESTWIDGPPDDPREELDIGDYLAGLSDVELASLEFEFCESRDWRDEMGARGIDHG